MALDKRLRRLFNLAGLPYKSAHKFRHGHAVNGLQHAQPTAPAEKRLGALARGLSIIDLSTVMRIVA